MIDTDGFRTWLYEDELSPNTVKSYVHAVQQYSKTYDEITKANLIAYKQRMVQRYKPATVNLRITALLAYCRYIGQPVKLKLVKLPRRTHVENVITQEQLDCLMSGLRKDGNRCWAVNILLLSKTGMRISEAVRVTKRDVLAGSVTMQTKSHMRTIYFPHKLVREIRKDLEQLGANDHVMRTSAGAPIGITGVQTGLKRYAAAYGIPPEVMHPHAFRHYFAIEFLKRRNDIALLADLLGHSSVNMTRIYLQQSQERQQEAIDKTVDW